VIGLAVVALWLGAAAPEDATVKGILEGEAYQFCHDPSYPLTDEEAAWCPILEVQGAPMCPAFPQTCAAPRAELSGAPGRLATRKEKDDDEPQERGAGRGPRRGSDEPEPESAPMPDLSGLAKVLFWAIVVGGAIAIIAAIVSSAISRRRDAAEPEPAQPREGADAAPIEDVRARLPADIETLLRDAEEAERRGDFVRAVDCGHAALLRRLDHEGAIRLHRSRTTGDYIGDLRAHPQWRTAAAPVLRDIDRAQFRASGPDAPLTRSILSRVVALARAAASTALVLVLFCVVLACTGLQGRKSWPWSSSPSGSDAVIELLEKRGRAVKWRMAEIAELEEQSGTIVLLRGAALKPTEWEALREWVRTKGGTLVIGDRGGWPDWVGAQTRGDHLAALHPDDDPGGHVPGDARLDLGDERWEVLFERNHGPYAARRDLGFGTIVALADDHLFTNAALAVGHIEVVELVGDVGPIELVDGWTGEGASSPMESIERSHLTAAMAQLLLFVLALLLWRGWPFGRGRDPAPPPRRGFVDHARAMGLHYASARATGHAASVYASWALETLRREGAHGAAGLHGLAQMVAQRTGRDETEVMRTLVEAHGVAEGGAAHGPDDMQLLRELVRLVRERGGRR
jgi:hypothetical protein